ncbi:MAG: hypothetical protein V1915_02980 [Candidatus Bathyarchaeota archaeon]
MENKVAMKTFKPPVLIKGTPDKNEVEEGRRLRRTGAEQVSRFSELGRRVDLKNLGK